MLFRLLLLAHGFHLLGGPWTKVELKKGNIQGKEPLIKIYSEYKHTDFGMKVSESGDKSIGAE